jgi:FkbM family methyltransferase
MAVRFLVAMAKILRPVKWTGLGVLARFMIRLTKLDPSILIRLDEDSQILVNIRMRYWARLLDPEFSYEAGLNHVLKKLRTAQYTFIDGGANIGYWSILVSSPEFGNQRTIAIEALRDTYVELSKNLALNEGRFQIMQRAISDVHGERLKFYFNQGPESASLIPEKGDESAEAEYVQTITIDALLEQMEWNLDLVIFKLDVEGAEINALEGAQYTIRNLRPLVVYEDHGEDTSCAVSEFVFGLEGYRTFYVTRDKQFVPVTTLDHVRALKKNPRRGYNFFAIHSESPFCRYF